MGILLILIGIACYMASTQLAADQISTMGITGAYSYIGITLISALFVLVGIIGIANGINNNKQL